MNPIIYRTLVILLTVMTTLSYAQVDTVELVNTQQSDVRRVRVDVDRGGENKYVHVRRRPFKTRVFLLDVGMTGLDPAVKYRLDNDINPFEQDFSKSLNINVHLYMQRISLYRHYFNIMHGLTVEAFDYGFANSVLLQDEQPNLTFEYDDEIRYRKNKLKIYYLTLPVMFNFESRPGRFTRSMRFSAGVYGGIKIGSTLKRKSNQFGKEKIEDDFNLNRFRAGIRAQVGVGPINFYGTWNVTELFEPDQNGGFEVIPFTVGFSLVPF